jgi:hypothetical protein
MTEDQKEVARYLMEELRHLAHKEELEQKYYDYGLDDLLNATADFLEVMVNENSN